MSIVEQLATSLGRRDEEPNIELAAEIVSKKDKAAVKELITNLNAKNKDIRHDCIKVLYEIGARSPTLIKDYLEEFTEQLDSKSNRMVWGAMTAIDSITAEVPGKVFSALGKILDVADKGSVITKDHAVGILVKLCSNTTYKKDCQQLLFEQLSVAADNQFPMYAEKTLETIDHTSKEKYIDILNIRMNLLSKESQKKRINKILKKISKKH